jgi:hypothetical protein
MRYNINVTKQIVAFIFIYKKRFIKGRQITMNPNTFPLSLTTHIVFCIISAIFFAIQYYRQGYKYQILSIFAIGATMLLYLSQNKMFFYGIGIAELIMVILIFVIMSIEKKSLKK